MSRWFDSVSVDFFSIPCVKEINLYPAWWEGEAVFGGHAIDLSLWHVFLGGFSGHERSQRVSSHFELLHLKQKNWIHFDVFTDLCILPLLFGYSSVRIPILHQHWTRKLSKALTDCCVFDKSDDEILLFYHHFWNPRNSGNLTDAIILQSQWRDNHQAANFCLVRKIISIGINRAVITQVIFCSMKVVHVFQYTAVAEHGGRNYFFGKRECCKIKIVYFCYYHKRSDLLL